MGEKREIGEAVLKMYYIAKVENIPNIDLHSVLEVFTDKWAMRGVDWCKQRKYINNRGITKRGVRYIKKRLGDEGEDLSRLKATMLRILSGETVERRDENGKNGTERTEGI